MDTKALIDAINAEADSGAHVEPNHRKAWRIIKSIFTNFPKWFGLYLGLAGLFTFNCFILEEAFQTIMFGSWSAFDAKEYRLVKREIAAMEKMLGSLNTINNLGGWLNPFGYIAYRGYVTAEREYIDALSAKLFAYAPEQFHGEVVTLTFIAQEEEPSDGFTKYRNGRVTVWATQAGTIYTGLVTAKNQQIVIDAREGSHESRK